MVKVRHKKKPLSQQKLLLYSCTKKCINMYRKKALGSLSGILVSGDTVASFGKWVSILMGISLVMPTVHEKKKF